MDIVSRLKVFIDTKGIPVTQFADNCRIPRPSMSQLLSGRNKKISDEVITKIHDAYPNLSVMWLMFGEGLMENVSNIQTSEPQNSPITDDFSTQTPNNEAIEGRINFDFEDNDDTSKKSGENCNSIVTDFEEQAPYYRSAISAQPPAQQYSRQAEPQNANPTSAQGEHKPSETPQEKKATTLTLQTDNSHGKRVIGIVVYYNDNSYESFVPDSTRKSPF
mgnify:FL=1